MTYDDELTAIQTWVKSVSGLPSWKLNESPSKLPRPVIIFETPLRKKIRNNSRYEYVMSVQQYGRLCVRSAENAAQFQDALITDLEERCNTIAVTLNGQVARKLKNVELDFTGEDLDSTFILSYEVSYYRNEPETAPHATRVIHNSTYLTNRR